MDGARSAARTIQNNLLDSSKQARIFQVLTLYLLTNCCVFLLSGSFRSLDFRIHRWGICTRLGSYFTSAPLESTPG